MLFSSIPQLTSPARYTIDVSLADIKRNIERYKQSYGLELEPEFQRGHVWSMEQRVKYIEFLLQGGKTNNEFLFNYPGWQKTFKGKMVLVDGLQRLTTIFMFLDDKIEVFGGVKYSDFEDKGHLEYSINFKISINDIPEYENVLKWYVEMNEGSTPHSAEEINKVKNMINSLKNK